MSILKQKASRKIYVFLLAVIVYSLSTICIIGYWNPDSRSLTSNHRYIDLVCGNLNIPKFRNIKDNYNLGSSNSANYNY